MTFSCRKFLSFLIVPVLCSVTCPAVENNVRRDKFDWMTVRTAHFDIYYDKNTEKLVPRMAHYLESAWHDVGQQFNFYVPDRTPFFFYSNHNEFEQTNIVSIGEGTGGVTEAFKNRFLIFNDGSEEWMKHVIYHEFSHVVQFNVLYGGFWKSVRLLKSPFYPLWMMEGAAESGSGTIDDATGDMVVRDAFANNQLPKLAELQGFAHLKPNQVTLGYKTGDMAMEFLQDEYGPEKIHDLLFAMRDFFDISSALESILGGSGTGADLDRFDFRFREWLGEKYNKFLKTAEAPGRYGTRLTRGDGIPQFNESPAIAPDGKKIYYFSDRGGPFQVYGYDIETKKAEALIPLIYRKYEYLHPGGRAMSISPNGRWLAFSAEKEQRDFLYLYDLQRKKLRRVKIPFDEIRYPSFSPVDDNRLVCTGMKRGTNDLYLIDRDAKIVKRLTDSVQDEKSPVFRPDGKSILYSAEMMSEDLSEPMGRDLFEMNLQTQQVTRLTDRIGSELEPEPLPDGSVLYTRDRDDQGAYGFNIYRQDASGRETRLTNLVGGGFSPRYSAADKNIYFVGFDAGEKHLYKSTWSFETPIESSPPNWPQAFVSEKAAMRAVTNWPGDQNAQLFSTVGRPYRFKASTDIFIPFFFYSSVDGFVVMDVWQFSDLLGNHQFQQQAQYAGRNGVNLSAVYTYARFRPTFSIGVQKVRFYRDFAQQQLRDEFSSFGLINYPFDRITSITVGGGITDRQDTFLDASEADNRFADRFFLTGLAYDTITGRYLVPTKGRRFQMFYQQGVDKIGGDQSYKTGIVDATQYIPIPRESTLATHAYFARSIGADAQVFRLGGIDRVRALSADSEMNKKTNVAYANAELRLRIKYLNARTAFLFPDFFFKAAYLIVFDDAGYGWDNAQERDAFDAKKLENSAGVGISWPTFILQSFQMNLTVQWAHRTNTGTDVWYISVGPSF